MFRSSKKLNSLIIKDYKFSQVEFILQVMMDLKTTLDLTLELKNDKGTDYVPSWKSNGLRTPKLNLLYTAFLRSI